MYEKSTPKVNLLIVNLLNSKRKEKKKNYLIR